MEINPYQSPSALQPLQEQELADSNSVRQLLVEIRDGQRELLQLQREALKAQQKFKRFAPLTMVLPIIIFGLFMAYSSYLRTSLRPVSIPTTQPPMRRVTPVPAPAKDASVRPPSDKAAD